MSLGNGPAGVFDDRMTPRAANGATLASGSAVYPGDEEWRASERWAEKSSEEEGSLSSASSSSSEEEEEGEGEEQRRLKVRVLASLGSLEDALPVKKGLSSCFSGKSKSFATLSDAESLCSAGDLGKPEHPINKRRRITMACRTSWRRRATSATLMSSRLRVLAEDEEEHGEHFPSLHSSPDNFKSSEFFSLSDLQRA